MGGGSSKKSADPISIYNKYSNQSRITSSVYIDPDGFEYGKECVGCHDCIFRTKGGILANGCKIYDKPDAEMAKIVRDVISSKHCDYFLDRSFDDAEDARKELDNIYEGCLSPDGSRDYSIKGTKTQSNLGRKIAEFTEKYYSPYIKTLNLNTDSKLPTGRFDHYTLGVTFSGLDQEFIKSSKVTLKTLERDFGSELSSKVDVSRLLKEYPDLINMIIGQELLAHENFHLYQTLVLNTPYKLYDSSRQIAYLRAMIFFSMIKEGVKIDIDSFDSIFYNIENFDNEEASGTLESLFNLYRSNADIIDNFFNYKECELGVDVVDLFEGAAFCFQKLINRSVNVSTFNALNDSYYMKSKRYFSSKGGVNDIVYLLFCHLSLKYGLLDDGDFMDVMPTPQNIFHHLCNSIEEVERGFDETPLSIKSFFGCSATTSQTLISLGVELDSDESDFFDSLTVDSEQVNVISIICKAIDMCHIKVEELYSQMKVKFSYTSCVIDDERALAIKEKALLDYSAFESDKFLAALITIPTFGQKFILSELPSYLSVTYQGLMGMNLTAEEENSIYTIVDEIDQLHRGPIYCCPEHGEATFTTLSQCCHQSSLNMRVQSILGLSLTDIID